MKTNRTATLTSALCLGAMLAFGAAEDASAQQRSGFIIGLGIGAGYTNLMPSEGDSEGKVSLATDFKIGGMLNSTTALYYVNMMNFYNESVLGEDFLFGSGVGGLGATFFLDDSAPVAYVDATIGISQWGCFKDECEDLETGFGLGVGTGFALGGTTFIDLDVMWGRPYSEGGDNLDVLTAKASFNWLSR